MRTKVCVLKYTQPAFTLAVVFCIVSILKKEIPNRTVLHPQDSDVAAVHTTLETILYYTVYSVV